MARARNRSNRTVVRRPVEWGRIFSVQTTVIGAAGVSSAAAFVIIGGAGSDFDSAISPTLVRIRGSLCIAGDIAAGLGFWSAGIVQMSAKAFAVGITAIPIPMVDDADWQWFDSGCIGDSVAITSAVGENDIDHRVIDSKSMRKYQQNDDVGVFVFANNTGVAGDDISFRFGLSLLVKE